MGESEGPHPQPLERPQHPQAGPDAVPALHRNHTRYPPSLVRINNLGRRVGQLQEVAGAPDINIQANQDIVLQSLSTLET